MNNSVIVLICSLELNLLWCQLHVCVTIYPSFPILAVANNISFFIFRKVEYVNAKGSFLDSHTIKAVLKNGTEVQNKTIVYQIDCVLWVVYILEKKLQMNGNVWYNLAL